jgi:hypothetical protein
MPRPPHERFSQRSFRQPPFPENEPTHGEIFDALMDLRERLERVEDKLRRTT